MKIEYRQETSIDLIQAARNRFSNEVTQLKRLGFFDLCVYTELLPKYSILTLLPIFIMAKLKREIIRVETPLRLVMAQPLLAHQDHGAYAIAFGMGIKLHTLFTDGTCVVTTNFPSQPIQNMQTKVYKSEGSMGIADCWAKHISEVDSFEKMGKQIDKNIRFTGYVFISQREEESASTYLSDEFLD
jgi:hypothetical protein